MSSITFDSAAIMTLASNYDRMIEELYGGTGFLKTIKEKMILLEEGTIWSGPIHDEALINMEQAITAIDSIQTSLNSIKSLISTTGTGFGNIHG